MSQTSDPISLRRVCKFTAVHVTHLYAHSGLHLYWLCNHHQQKFCKGCLPQPRKEWLQGACGDKVIIGIRVIVLFLHLCVQTSSFSVPGLWDLPSTWHMNWAKANWSWKCYCDLSDYRQLQVLSGWYADFTEFSPVGTHTGEYFQWNVNL